MNETFPLLSVTDLKKYFYIKKEILKIDGLIEQSEKTDNNTDRSRLLKEKQRWINEEKQIARQSWKSYENME